MATTPRFSPRQLEVIFEIGTGSGAKTVARRFGVSVATVKGHVRLIALKLEHLYPAYQPRERIILYYRERLLPTQGSGPTSD